MGRELQQMTRFRAWMALAALALAAMASCTKEVRQGTGTEMVSFCAGILTKSGDGDISTLDLLVFRENGQRETHVRCEGNTAQAVLPTGIPLRWHLVANAPAGQDLGGILTEGALLSSRALLEGQTPSGIIMAGSGSRVLDKGTGTIGVQMTRTVSRITLEALTPDFLRDSYGESTVRLEGIHVINAAGSCPYTLIPDAGGVWHNRMGPEEGLGAGLAALLRRTPGTILNGDRISGPWTFYTCPNPTDNGVCSDTMPVWSERNTRLVIELSIDGVPNWYPMTLPPMECNTEYLIREAVLKGPGSASPDIPVRRQDIAFTVSVRPWEHTQTEAEFK